MSTTIEPTVGRIVYFFEAMPHTQGAHAGLFIRGPLAAIVTAVWSKNHVNIAVLNENGTGPVGLTSVRLLQPGETRPTTTGIWCEWMPYQIGQAQKLAGSQFTAAELAARAMSAVNLGGQAINSITPAVMQNKCETAAPRPKPIIVSANSDPNCGIRINFHECGGNAVHTGISMDRLAKLLGYLHSVTGSEIVVRGKGAILAALLDILAVNGVRARPATAGDPE